MKNNVFLMLGVLLMVFSSCAKKEVIETYENNSPKLVYEYKDINGKKVKVKEIRYYENKQKRLEGKFDKDGNKTGEWTFFFSTGDVFAKADFTNTETGLNWEVFDIEKKPLVLKEEKVIALHFAEDNGLCDIKVKKAEGEIFYKFFENFTINQRINTIGNILQGESMSWYENGQVNSIHYYRDGIQDSLYQVFSAEGNTIIKGQYKMGVKIGKWEYYLSDGTPQGTEIYDIDGTILKRRK
jgi:antitoxin component YwqK of YwqJK toxin-antitoxin module